MRDEVKGMLPSRLFKRQRKKLFEQSERQRSRASGKGVESRGSVVSCAVSHSLYIDEATGASVEFIVLGGM